MKNRLYARVLGLLSLIVVSSFVLSGCKDTLQEAQAPIGFGALRVINMLPCRPPVNVFITQEGAKADTLPQIPGLKFGVPSAYATNLPVSSSGSNYTLVVHPVGDNNTTFATSTINLKSNNKQSLMLFQKADNSIDAKVITDPAANVNLDTTKVFVRFINADADHNSLSLRINDPLNSQVLASNVPFETIGDYQPLNFAKDTSFTLFVQNGDGNDGNVLARLSGETFAPGSYHTVTYSGNKCATSEDDNSIDSLRIRVFDDNDEGIEQTNPIPLTLRYNVINALIPVSPNDTVKTNIRTYDTLGISINNDLNPAKGGFTFPYLRPLTGAIDVGSDGDVHKLTYATTTLTDAILVSAYDMDNTGGQRGEVLFSYRAGKRTDIQSDLPVSLIVLDTTKGRKILADSTNIKQVAVPIPDRPYIDSIRIVVVNALAPGRRLGGTAQNIVSFTVNGTDLSNFDNKPPTTYDYINIPATSPISVALHCGLRASGAVAAQDLDKTVTMEPGGIYEVLVVGQRTHTDPRYQPQFYIARTNPKF